MVLRAISPKGSTKSTSCEINVTRYAAGADVVVIDARKEVVALAAVNLYRRVSQLIRYQLTKRDREFA